MYFSGHFNGEAEVWHLGIIGINRFLDQHLQFAKGLTSVDKELLFKSPFLYLWLWAILFGHDSFNRFVICDILQHWNSSSFPEDLVHGFVVPHRFPFLSLNSPY